MTINKAKEELSSYLMMESSKKELQEWINNKKYNSKVTSTLSSEPKGSRKHQDSMAEKLATALDSEKKIKLKIDHMKKKQENIMNKLLNMEIPYQTVLFDIYIVGKSIEETATAINYSRSQTIRIG